MLNHPTVPGDGNTFPDTIVTGTEGAQPALPAGQVPGAPLGNPPLPDAPEVAVEAAAAAPEPNLSASGRLRHLDPFADAEEAKRARAALRQEIAEYIEREEALMAAQEAAELRAQEEAIRKERELARRLEQEADEDELREAAAIRAKMEAEKQAQRLAEMEVLILKEADRDEARIARQQVPLVHRWVNWLAKAALALLLLALLGVGGFLLFYSVDKPGLEKALSSRLGMDVTVGEATFAVYPPELRLRAVKVGALELPTVVARPELATLLSARKVWRSVEIAGFAFDAAQAGRLAALARPDPLCAGGASWKVQRIRAAAVAISGMPVAIPKLDAEVRIGADCAVSEAVLTLPEARAQVTLAPDPAGWRVDAEASGHTWPAGPAVALESIRARGIANADGMKFESVMVSLADGVVRGSGELGWKSGWKYIGVHEVIGLDVDTLAEAFYGKSPVSGAMDGKFSVAVQGDALPALFRAPDITGEFNLRRAQFKTVDVNRLFEGINAGAGTSRFNEFGGNLRVSGGTVQVSQWQGESSTVRASGALVVRADQTLAGALNVESRARAGGRVEKFRVGGSVAQPTLGR